MADTLIWTGTTNGDWGTDTNFSPAQVPITGDTVIMENNAVAVTGTLDQSAVTLAALIIKQSYTGTIGTAATYLQIGATLVDIGEHYGYGTPLGSQRIMLDFGTVASTINIHNTCTTSADSGRAPVRIKIVEATSDIFIRKGTVGIGANIHGDLSTVDEIHVGFVDSKASDATVVIGASVTLDELQMTGGEVTLQCAATTVGVIDGTLYTEGSGAITTMTVEGGTVYSNSSGTITTLNAKGGTVDFTKSSEDRTVTTTDYWVGAKIKWDPTYITLTNDPEPQEAGVLTCAAL